VSNPGEHDDDDFDTEAAKMSLIECCYWLDPEHLKRACKEDLAARKDKEQVSPLSLITKRSRLEIFMAVEERWRQILELGERQRVFPWSMDQVMMTYCEEAWGQKLHRMGLPPL